MATTLDYINQLKEDKKNLVAMLNNMGVEASDSDTFTSLTPKVGKIVTDPILQDKSIEITENGTQTITADEGYDGLNDVEITTNISSGGTFEKGFVVKEFDSNGYPTEIELVGMTSLPNYGFGAYSTGDNYLNLLTKNLKKVILSNELTIIPNACFQNITTLENFDFKNVTTINGSAFFRCSKLNIKSLPDTVKNINSGAFRYSGIKQISMNAEIINNNYMSFGPFGDCSNLKAVWIGEKVSFPNGGIIFNGCSALIKIFINLPRTTVEKLPGYAKAFCDNANKASCIVCNDEEGFMTREEFDAIDWTTQ